MCRTCPVPSLVTHGWTPQRDMLLFDASLLGIPSVILMLAIVRSVSYTIPEYTGTVI